MAAVLRSFRVANHRSIKDEQELVLLAAYEQASGVVPVAAVLGANASGKSNLLDAMAWMQHAVLHSYRLWEAESGVPRRPFRFDPETVGSPSSFAVDLTLDGIPYTYGFSVTDEAVVEEWLHAYPHGRERLIFERKGRQVELGSTIGERRGRAEVLTGLLRDNALLLSTAVQANQAEVLPLHRWFRDSLRLDSRTASRPGHLDVDAVAEALDRFPSLAELIKAADLGITSVVVEHHLYRPTEAEQFEAAIEAQIDSEARQGAFGQATPARSRRYLREPLVVRKTKKVMFLHGTEEVALGVEEQSAGTLAWTTLLVAALAALQDGVVLVVDEVDASLHPRLTARLIELFRNTDTNTRGAQLLFTTHDATLLGTNLGGEILRRDEIWFIEKRDGASHLYPLSDFHPRKGENRERRYLAGSYGAVPAIFSDSLVESMLADRAEPVDGPA